MERADVVVVGAGAAGLMAGIFAGRSGAGRVVLLDGARKLGAKILVAGGGRCNVTHHAVNARAYAGSTRGAIKKVLRRFDVPATVDFFADLGVDLKREETGKLFPTTDSAKTVLGALLRANHEAGVEVRHPRRVETVEPAGDGFRVMGEWGEIEAARVVLATGGKSLPKSGSDGHGYRIAETLGHTVTRRVFPALVPLTLPAGHPLCALSGVTVPATIQLRSATGKKGKAFTDSTLLTHFGLSGPSVLDLSRYWLDAREDDEGAHVTVDWLPGTAPAALDADFQALGTTVLRFLRERLPERLARALLDEAGVGPETTGDTLTRADRRALVEAVTALRLPLTGDRGYRYAEVTAGGVPLAELDLGTMASRCTPGLYLCGEVCDVDGRIGGFNFQWAWASGHVAGTALGQTLSARRAHVNSQRSPAQALS
ncbi:MAG: NAD(P)/FAD-dependent oxidoreductase [Bacteroidota bacterium]